MHSHSNKYFGLDHNNYIGSLNQENTLHDDGIEFLLIVDFCLKLDY